SYVAMQTEKVSRETSSDEMLVIGVETAKRVLSNEAVTTEFPEPAVAVVVKQPETGRVSQPRKEVQQEESVQARLAEPSKIQVSLESPRVVGNLEPTLSSPPPAPHPVPWIPNSVSAGNPVRPQQAPYAPMFADQFELIKEKLERVQDQAEFQQEMFKQTLVAVQEGNLRREQELLNRLSGGARTGNAKAANAAILEEETALDDEVAYQETLPETKAANEFVADAGEGDDNITLNVNNADIRGVLDLLSQHGGLNILASPSVSGTVTASLTNVDVMTALQAILKSTGFIARSDADFIYIGTPQDLKEMEHGDDEIVTRIYRPYYVNVQELERLILPLLTPNVGSATTNGSSLATTGPAQSGISPDSSSSGGDDYAGQDVLLVRDYQAVLEEIDRIVQEIDIQPLQVAIEATILSVRLDDRNERGVNFEVFRNKPNVGLNMGNPLTDLANLNLTEGGVKFGFLDSNLSAFVEALETIGDTTVVASPRLMCLNKQRAEIQIGSELGYVSTTVTQNAATQAVEFLEVGTLVRFRPYITPDRMVRLEIHPELSTGSVRVEENLTLPDKEVTQVTTNVMCPDGRTVIIGGLIREDLSTTSTQIPYLGSLPVVGAAFRHTNETIDRREIIVLITPKIVCEPFTTAEGEQVAEEYMARQANYREQMAHLGKRNQGGRYLRLASVAWLAGDVKRAQKFINLSVHFDPLNRDALRLREEIVGSQGEFPRKVLVNPDPYFQFPQLTKRIGASEDVKVQAEQRSTVEEKLAPKTKAKGIPQKAHKGPVPAPSLKLESRVLRESLEEEDLEDVTSVSASRTNLRAKEISTRQNPKRETLKPQIPKLKFPTPRAWVAKTIDAREVPAAPLPPKLDHGILEVAK
ncbi:MAG: hypothetical protein MK165_05730, partial [Pirellulaceae bacterium]|nr:hypothetical protein [Pirellulaceae bacterium]